jgi:prepilin-type N-terminal cleavage/methylation domain
MKTNMLTTPIRGAQKGFTILEVMISTLVFGVVLVVITTAIMQFSHVYYRGVTESTVQDTARTITDLISQGIQFNGGDVTTTTATPVAGSSYAFCVGNQQYSYTVGYQMKDSPSSSQTYHALAVRDLSGCTASSTAQNMRNATLAAGSRELLAQNMRLARLQVTQVSADVYKVSVRVVYGDDDILNNPTTATAACKNLHAGGQFCAVSDITTTVVKRVE